MKRKKSKSVRNFNSFNWLCKTKTIKFLSGLTEKNISSDRDTQQHYAWERKNFHDLMFEISKRDFTRMFNILCDAYGVPRPEITFIGNDRLSLMDRVRQTASSAYMDGKLLVCGRQCVAPYIVIHEFVHFYLWHKYKMVKHHGTPIMKKMVYELHELFRCFFSASNYKRNYRRKKSKK